MNNKSFKNWYFVIVCISLCCFVVLLNYFVDPYKVFNNKFYMNFYNIPRNYAHIYLKAYKNIKYDTVFIGSSNTNSLFSHDTFCINYFNKISMDAFSYKQQYEILKDYLIFHPETKNIYIVICYPVFLYDIGEPVSALKSRNFNIKELVFLLFSKDSIEKSISEIRKGALFNIDKYKKQIYYQNIYDSTRFAYFPYSVPNLKMKEKDQKYLNQINKLYLIKIIALLKEKKINYQIIIPPYHAMYLTMISQIPHMKSTIEELIRLCTELSDGDVLDFSLVNKYTTVDINKNNYLYTDLIHPNFIIGYKIFKVLHDDYNEEDFYVKLNKNNVDEHIKQLNKKIDEYFILNKAEVINKLEFDVKSKDVDISKKEYINLDKLPSNIAKDLVPYNVIINETSKLYLDAIPKSEVIFKQNK